MVLLRSKGSQGHGWSMGIVTYIKTPPLESSHCILFQLFEGFCDFFGIMDEHMLLIEVHSTMHPMDPMFFM